MDTDKLFLDLAALAASQHGATSWRQARHLGISRDALRHQVAIGAWHRPSQRVLVAAGSPSTYKQDLTIAALDAGPIAGVAAEAAGSLWGVPGFFAGPVEVVRLRGPRRGDPFLGEVHETR